MPFIIYPQGDEIGEPMKVKEIKARVLPDQPLTRVAVYARVSSAKEAAEQSLEQQVSFYNSLIQSRVDWTLAGIFAEESGTSGTKDRPEFQRMMNLCREGKVDMVITKSITRWARNILTTLESIRELKALHIDVYFEKEHIHTESADGEFILTMLAMYAEEESRSASENILWRIRKRFEAGEPWVLNRTYGYRVERWQYLVEPGEAEVVKRIYSEFVEGKSLYEIAKGLNRDSIRTMYGGLWRKTTVTGILQNPVYSGDLYLQKTYRENFRTKKTIQNYGERKQYLVPGHHEAIVNRETFEFANARLKKPAHIPPGEKQANHLFSSLITCGKCGCKYYYRLRRRQGLYICQVFDELGKAYCPSQQIPEQILTKETAKVLGIAIDPDENAEEKLTRDVLTAHINRIIVPAHNTLIFELKDGRKTEVHWKHLSRSLSWTDEMKQKAREKTLKRNEAKKKPGEGRKEEP